MKSSFIALALAAAASLLAAVGCLSFALTSNPGPESAQVLAVAGGVALCLAQAARSSARKQDGFFADALGGLILAGAMIALFIVVTAVGGVVRPSCSPSKGFLPFFFLALPVLVLHVGIGTWLGRLLGKPGRAVIAAIIVELALGGSLLLEWYRAPSFRVISHAFVVVSGDLLDGASMPPAVIGFRFATLLFGVALLCAGAARYPRIRRTGLTTQSVGGVTLYAFAAAALVVGIIAHILTVDALVPSRAEMEREYSLVKKRGPLVIHADPIAVRPKDVDALLAEGTLWLDRIDARLGVKPQGEINIWVHASREAEAKWTGAEHVDFTLPWRREIHIVGVEVPHRSLGHELAHAVAGDLSDTVLHVPTDFVVFEHAAVIEGLAVALTPELAVDGGLTVKEQAAAMKKAGYAPDISTLFRGLSFFEESPARAYTAAGAFIESLVAKSLPDPTQALATLYRTGSIEQAAGGKDALKALIEEHDAMLSSLPIPADATAIAHARFEKPSILKEVCAPKDLERAREIRVDARTGDVDAALQLAGDAKRETLEDLFGDLRDVEDTTGLVEVGERLDAIADNVDAAARTDELGDAMWLAGKQRDAIAAWDRAKVEELPFDMQRTLLAKRIFADAIVTTADRAPVSRAALDVLLAHTQAQRASGFERLHYWLGVDDAIPGGAVASAAPGKADAGPPPETTTRDEPKLAVMLGRYIHARRLVQTGALIDAVRDLRKVLEEKDLPSVFVEQAKLFLGTALVKDGAAQEASALFIEAADAADRPAMRLLLRDRAERANRAAAAPERPARVTATSDPAWADRLLLGNDDSTEP